MTETRARAATRVSRKPGERRVDTAFEVQLETLRPQLMRLAYWLSRDHAIAEDLVQETMLRALRSQEQLKETYALRKWLFTICRREHARLYQRKRHPTTDIDELPADSQPTARESDSVEILQLREAILGLDDMYREPLVLQVMGGYSTEEIAGELGLNIATVLTRLFRARNQLRARFGVGPGDEPA